MIHQEIIDKIHKLLMEYTDNEPLDGDEVEEIKEGLNKLNGNQ